ncbi:MAG: hypothetical protein A3F11_02990 [Gammaproteobacteria bacterium RIFCSPHIGHO2_12_FULL_37_14]|nr:MAG: hypothetical protein A3F11_02990 [Gammaproteobacteria bacterium RIFCSPHIGHO2_12_FULL_37_14]
MQKSANHIFMEKTDNIESLQALRAIAAIVVLFYHGAVLSQVIIEYQYAHDFFKFGYAGVDIFFVISGFIIYYTSYIKRERLNIIDFILSRLTRIFPIYWVAAIVTLALFTLEKVILHNNSGNIYYCNPLETSFSNVLKSLFLIPAACPILAVSWTLHFEILFYTVFGLLFFISSRLFLVVMMVWVVFCYLNNFMLDLDIPLHIRGILDPDVTEFLYGCVIAIIFLRITPKYAGRILSLGIVLFMLAAIANYFAPRSLPYRYVFFGIPSALIVYGAINFKSKYWKLLNYLGDASYSIYLFHYSLIGFVFKLILFAKLTNYFNNFIAVTLIMILAISVCCFIYSYIEKPILLYARKQIKFHKSKWTWLDRKRFIPINEVPTVNESAKF